MDIRAYLDRSDIDRAALIELAERCEFATESQWASMMEEVCSLTTPLLAKIHGIRWPDRRDRALSYATVGAIESAVLTLLPSAIDLTGGTTKGRTEVVAQALVQGVGAAYTRRAKTLAMGWLAAYLHALANGVAKKAAATSTAA